MAGLLKKNFVFLVIRYLLLVNGKWDGVVQKFTNKKNGQCKRFNGKFFDGKIRLKTNNE